MIKEKFTALRRELTSLTSTEKVFILCAMLCSFLISADYAIVRPVSNSVFISAYSSAWFPYAWLAAVPLNLIVVALYNKYLPRLGCFKMFLSFGGVVTAVAIFSACFLKQIPWLPFFFYIWKEVYIMLMFQQLWSVIHTTISLERAKYLYGILFGVGALGSVTGSMIPSFLAVKMGSESLLLANLPIFLLLIGAYFYLTQITTPHNLKIEDQTNRMPAGALKHGIQLILRSKLLLFILLIVIFMQVSSSLIEYQFNHFLERTIAEKDLRTQYIARILVMVHSATLALQFFGSFLLIQFLGIRRSHFVLPMLLCLNSIGCLFFPAFAMISLSYITIKCFDFSLFGVIKEMLYIPLQPDEKFRAKAVIDVFAYRAAKAVASFLILAFQILAIVEIQSFLSWTSILIFVIWCVTAARMLRGAPILTSQ
jgi:AAA family ATP:ADP antiporter